MKLFMVRIWANIIEELGNGMAKSCLEWLQITSYEFCFWIKNSSQKSCFDSEYIYTFYEKIALSFRDLIHSRTKSSWTFHSDVIYIFYLNMKGDFLYKGILLSHICALPVFHSRLTVGDWLMRLYYWCQSASFCFLLAYIHYILYIYQCSLY